MKVVLIIALLMSLSRPAMAENGDLARFGAGFLVTTAFHQIFKATEMDKYWAWGLSFAVTGLGAYAAESSNSSFSGEHFAFDLLGAGTAVGVGIALDL